jgi:hypothetical protein
MKHFIVKQWETWNKRVGCTVYHCQVWQVKRDGLTEVIGHYLDSFVGPDQLIWQAFQSHKLLPAKVFTRSERTSSPCHPVHTWKDQGFAIVSIV